MAKPSVGCVKVRISWLVATASRSSDIPTLKRDASHIGAFLLTINSAA
jgi:hypothetical protein